MGTYIYEWKAAYAINVLKGKHKKMKKIALKHQNQRCFMTDEPVLTAPVPVVL